MRNHHGLGIVTAIALIASSGCSGGSDGPPVPLIVDVHVDSGWSGAPGHTEVAPDFTFPATVAFRASSPEPILYVAWDVVDGPCNVFDTCDGGETVPGCVAELRQTGPGRCLVWLGAELDLPAHHDGAPAVTETRCGYYSRYVGDPADAGFVAMMHAADETARQDCDVGQN